MTLDRAISISDLRRLAMRRLPRMAFDFIDGGCDGEDGSRRERDGVRRLPAGASLPRRRVQKGHDHADRRAELRAAARLRADRRRRHIPPRRGPAARPRGGGGERAFRSVERQQCVDRGGDAGCPGTHVVPALRHLQSSHERGHGAARGGQRCEDAGAVRGCPGAFQSGAEPPQSVLAAAPGHAVDGLPGPHCILPGRWSTFSTAACRTWATSGPMPRRARPRRRSATCSSVSFPPRP